MLNIEVNRSAKGVEQYEVLGVDHETVGRDLRGANAPKKSDFPPDFDRELAVSDYLMKEPGIWAGRGAGSRSFSRWLLRLTEFPPDRSRRA
jgi:hypothetical protein